MKLERLKDVQMDELMQWNDTIEDVLTPDNLVPTSIKQYPQYIETSERLKRICEWNAKNLKDKMQEIEDVIMDSIEAAEFVYKVNEGGMPVLRKKYATAAKQARELRLRLSLNEDYQAMALEQKQWKIMYSDWVSHAKRLHRDFRLLEVNYQSNGGDGMGI
jgi:hypothetical protein